MKKREIYWLIILIALCTCMFTGCWNYREIEKMAIVAGVAIDKSEDGKTLITVEIISVSSSKDKSATNPVYIQTSGDSFFDAVRKLISVQGKKLYWSHTKVVIVSEAIAREGISHYLDFLSRDAEIRKDMWIIMSREKTAQEIFDVKPSTESIVSIEIDNAMRAQTYISRYPSIEFYQFMDELANEKAAAVLPTINVIEINRTPSIFISGAAVIKGNRLIGYLDDYESKSLLWILDELKGGLYVVENLGKEKSKVTLEISKNKTKLKPELKDNNIEMSIKISLNTSIGGIIGEEDYISEPGRSYLKQEAERQIKEHLEHIIKKAQKELKADILGFGLKIRRSMPQVWKSVEKDWEDFFTEVEYNIVVDVNIEGSGVIKKSTKVVD